MDRAHRLRVRRRGPHERELARFVRELELVDAVRRALRVAVAVDGHHVRRAASIALLVRLERDARETTGARGVTARVVRDELVALVHSRDGRTDVEREKNVRPDDAILGLGERLHVDERDEIGARLFVERHRVVGLRVIRCVERGVHDDHRARVGGVVRVELRVARVGDRDVLLLVLGWPLRRVRATDAQRDEQCAPFHFVPTDWLRNGDGSFVLQRPRRSRSSRCRPRSRIAACACRARGRGS